MKSGQDWSAVIVGGGIGGMAAAIALRAVGWSVTVLEEHARPSGAGSGISLWPNAMRVLEQFKLADQVRALAAPVPSVGGLRVPSGRWLTRTAAGSASLPDVVVLRRADLHSVLLGALPPGCLRTRVTAVGVAPAPTEAGRPTVFARGAAGTTELAADLVVAADGMRSSLRRHVAPEAGDPVYSGYTTWRGITPAGTLSTGDSGETWGRSAKFGYLPLQGERVYWYAELPAPAGRRDDNERAALLERFAGWHEPIPSLLRATPSDRIIRTDVDYVPKLPTYVRGGVALLGDAAHGMTPDLGQGGCQALEDAVVLATCVAQGSDVASALDAYDAGRRPRTQAVATAARRMGWISEWGNPAAVALRNLAVRLTPPRIALAPLSRISDWAPPSI
ncbi:FAD-dependent monooxygenase [Paenarthrobacter sp. DKR-5]|uniref:FAD-dependent monooxygenase n=1 Tax=Paenarthrobacter sp. DKR-5 TaxID=2835535 RepID=UPI001BDD15C1|nr:FAD-dependent monooxygenase [Paenarthrobacter sp. DKR-5]MBT1001678.1 FAD-dependent monooxygenase [Paenarthrobacter sp. DKR-5]